MKKLSLTLLTMTGLLSSAQADLTVFAAASTSDALEEIARDFESKTQQKIRFSFAGSSLLGRQIEAGARVDLFLSADNVPIERLEKQGAIKAADHRTLLGNTLVVIASGDGKTLTSPSELRTRGRIATGDPETVPVGRYAKKWLEGEKLWAELGKQIVPMLDVRAALSAMASGAIKIGIVYDSDARSNSHVHVIYRVPSEKTGIIYPVAAFTPAGRQFLQFLLTESARSTFERLGFVVPR